MELEQTGNNKILASSENGKNKATVNLLNMLEETTRLKINDIEQLKQFNEILAAIPVLAQAQVLIISTAIGAVRHMSSEKKQGQPSGYDVATVLLEARAENVYRKAVEVLGASKEYRITRQADNDLTLDFTDGKVQAGLQVSPVADQVSQLVIASTQGSAKKDIGSVTVNGVLRICKEMAVRCEAARR